MTVRSLLPFTLLMFSGMLPAQTPQGTPPPPPTRGPRGGPGGGFGLGLGGGLSERRLATQLGLSAEQQNKVHTAIAEGRVQQQGMAQREGEIRTRLATAVKAGNEAQIDSVSQELAQLNQQRISVRAKTISRVYASLTPDQKTRVDAELSRTLGVPGVGRGGGPRLRRGGPGAPPPPPAAVQQ